MNSTKLALRLGLPAALALSITAPARAEGYLVGPGRTYPSLEALSRRLKPGDVVEIDGDAVYAGDVVLRASGAPGAPITITGRRVNGRRPVIEGGASTLEVRGDHYVIQGLEIRGGKSRCLFHHGHDLVVRDTVIHDCARHGVLGADDGSGSLTLSYVEVYNAGHGDGAHQLYIATDEVKHPRSVFRLEHSFIHDGRGGNNVKSRAERNEIYSNWIEGARYHELELIGPDGGDPKRCREDSDVVGNVILKRGKGYAIRIGGDGTGETDGRYRFVNDTILLDGEARAVFRIFNGIESLEVHNTVMARSVGGPLEVVREQEVRWAAGRPVIGGSHNWLPEGSTGVPSQWEATLRGKDPRFVSARDLRPADDSPLVGAGTPKPRPVPRFEFPSPRLVQEALPPPCTLERVGFAIPRGRALDIGALAHGAPWTIAAEAPAEPPPEPPPMPPEPPAAPAPLPVPATPPSVPTRVGCGCHEPSASRGPAAPFALAITIAALVPFRKRRSRRR